MPIIKKIIWIDKDIAEASVIISDTEFSLMCYASTCTLTENKNFEDYLYCLDVSYIYAVDSNIYEIKKTDETYYGYILKGKLVNKTNKIMLIGELRIDLSNADLPNDIMEGQFIEVKVNRIDIY
jgi:hypothetical protein